jgi:hypothetical protein
MRLNGPNSYAREWLIGENIWRLKFVKKIDDQGTMGLCDPGDKLILIRRGLDKGEMLKTLAHEVLHAFEDEYTIDISHKTVYKLEDAIFEFLLNNLDSLSKIAKRR